VTDPRTAALPGERPSDSPSDSPTDDPAGGTTVHDPGSTDVATRIESAGHDIAGVSEGPLAEAVVRLDSLHRELQGALADLDRA
jgi:hypothetical protein